MKKYLFTIFGLLVMLTAQGQKSIIKTNLGSWGVAQAANLTYEYQAGPKFSVGLTTHYKFSSTFDIDALAEQNDGEQFDWTGEVEAEGFAVTPFARYYTGEAMRGFYLELFLRYYTYDFVIPYDYEKNNTVINEDGVGDANGFGAGLALGSQFYLGPTVVLDIYAGMGFASGSAHAETPDDSALDAADFADIAQSIEDNKSVDVFLIGNTLENVEPGSNSMSAYADVENQLFPMLRAGISFGMKF